MYGFTTAFPWFEATRDWITLVTHMSFGVAVAGTCKMLRMLAVATKRTTIEHPTRVDYRRPANYVISQSLAASSWRRT